MKRREDTADLNDTDIQVPRNLPKAAGRDRTERKILVFMQFPSESIAEGAPKGRYDA